MGSCPVSTSEVAGNKVYNRRRQVRPESPYVYNRSDPACKSSRVRRLHGSSRASKEDSPEYFAITEKTQDPDPFYLAADICQDFVTIYPFKDGNGRMCRLIANAFLIKYAGIVISIGEHDEERKQYLAIAEMVGDGETEEEARGTLAMDDIARTDKKGSQAQSDLGKMDYGDLPQRQQIPEYPHRLPTP
jgi:fido (protein-threonine AMPylation protein)